MKSLATGLGMILFATSSPSMAQADAASPFLSGNNFQLFCYDNSTPGAMCLTYTMGVYHALRETPRGGGVCLPKEVNTGQLFSVGIKYIRANPELAHYSPAPLLIMSWERAFPCAKTP